MAIELEKHELRSFEIRKRKHKQKVTIISILSIFVAIIVMIFIINQFIHKNYTSFQVTNSIERKDSNSAKYQNYGANILRYSRDGAMAMDSKGNPLWNGTYEMNDPIVDICGDYVAISDRGYKTIEVFDANSSVSTINVQKPIIKTVISRQGVVAVLMDDTKVNYIKVFNKEGETLVDMRTTVENGGFPIDIDLSDDGQKLITSYASVNNGTLQSKVTFYNFDEVGQNYVWRIVAAYDYGKTLIPRIEFINNNTVCAFGDDKFSIYSMKKIPKLVKEVAIPSEIKSVFYSEKYIGFVLNNTEKDANYRILLYDLYGKLKLDKSMSYSYDNISLSGEEIILYSNLEWVIVRSNGEEKFHYTFDNNISCVLPVNKIDKYLIIDEHNMQEVKLTEK